VLSSACHSKWMSVQGYLLCFIASIARRFFCLTQFIRFYVGHGNFCNLFLKELVLG